MLRAPLLLACQPRFLTATCRSHHTAPVSSAQAAAASLRAGSCPGTCANVGQGCHCRVMLRVLACDSTAVSVRFRFARSHGGHVPLTGTRIVRTVTCPGTCSVRRAVVPLQGHVMCCIAKSSRRNCSFIPLACTLLQGAVSFCSRSGFVSSHPRFFTATLACDCDCGSAACSRSPLAHPSLAPCLSFGTARRVQLHAAARSCLVQIQLRFTCSSMLPACTLLFLYTSRKSGRFSWGFSPPARRFSRVLVSVTRPLKICSPLRCTNSSP